MIVFQNVTKFFKAGAAAKYILQNASFTLPERNIGILGLNGAGKSTLMRLIGAAEMPNKGHIYRYARVSWPMGFSGGIHLSLTGSENVRFVSRIYGEDIERVLHYVRDFTELGRYLDMPVASYSSGMRAKLAFGISMAIDFDCYLIDEITAVGDEPFQRKCREVFDEKKKKAKFILISHSDSTIQAYCDYGVILGNGRIRLYEDVEEAISVYKLEMVGINGK